MGKTEILWSAETFLISALKKKKQFANPVEGLAHSPAKW